MGLMCTQAFVDANTGIELAGAYLSFGRSQVTITPSTTGPAMLSCAAGVWKDKDSRTAGKSALTYLQVDVPATSADIQANGVYAMLYEALKSQQADTKDDTS